MAKMVKLGDILEIKTSDGYSYCQVTHKTPSHGYFIVAFKEKFPNKQTNLNDIAQSKVLFKTFYFVKIALKNGLVEIIGNAPIRNELQEFPIFKTSLPPELTGGKRAWRLWYGKEEGSSTVKKLTKKENKYPLLQLVGHYQLVLLIEKKWTHDVDPVLLTSDKDTYDVIS